MEQYQEKEKNKTLEKLELFCKENDISTSGICAFTFQQNRTGLFASIIVNWDSMVILNNYPLENLNNYQEKKLPRDVLMCYKTHLPELPKYEQPVQTSIEKSFPCCNSMLPYQSRVISKEAYFTDFINCKGSRPNIVYELKKQINNGPLIDTVYYELIDDQRHILNGNFTTKIHAFKNYRCLRCNLFFSIDLYHKDSTNRGYNYHHMRLNPFTKGIENLDSFI